MKQQCKTHLNTFKCKQLFLHSHILLQEIKSFAADRILISYGAPSILNRAQSSVWNIDLKTAPKYLLSHHSHVCVTLRLPCRWPF